MFTIPNEADAGVHANQSELDSGDVAILTAAHALTGVVSGGAVTAQGTPDMTVAVAVGVVAVAGVEVAVSAGNVTITAADATNPRFDLIVVDDAGAKSAVAGTAAAEPVYPAIPADSVVLAAVYVPANETAITSGHIVDKRVFINSEFSPFLVTTIAGEYYTTPYVSSPTTQNFAANTFRAVPFPLGRRTSFDRIAIEVTTGLGSAGTLYLGIYDIDGNLWLDAGTVDTNTTGLKEITIATTLAPRVWFLVAKNDTGAFSSRGLADQNLFLSVPTSGVSKNTMMLAQSVATGALPATWPSPVISAVTAPKIMLRAA